MKINRAASIPLVVHDPFFSIWSNTDKLYDGDTVHWSQARQDLKGYIVIDDQVFCFLGKKGVHPVIEQTMVSVTATSTEYTFENDKVVFNVKFTSPLVLSDKCLVSRPCTYIDFEVDKKCECSTEVYFEVSKDIVTSKADAVVGAAYTYKTGCEYKYAFMGRALQQPLSGSEDMVTIDWGYVYLACEDMNADISFDMDAGKLIGKLLLEDKGQLIIAYDDLLSINYFGEWRKAYWTECYSTIEEAIGAAFNDYEDVMAKAGALDRDIEERAKRIGNSEYAFLCVMSYRQAVAAHKLICDEAGNIIFLSKENASNGCIGTVDVSYPSVPLFLMYDSEYVKGMMRPIFKFAACDAWEYDYAPHDVGRYPYAWGQRYAMKEPDFGFKYGQGAVVFPPIYRFPAGSDVYDFRYQMPVEECGNMLIMMAAVLKKDKNADFARPYVETLNGWVKYLLEYGEDPGEQLCTDDFAGQLAHNVNLSAKAIMGIEAYSIIMGMLGDKNTEEKYHAIAKEMAAGWEKRANAGSHYMLSFGNPDSWSLKYNIVWDKIFGSGLFSDEVFEKEIDWYIGKTNEFGTPLDNRKDYTKSDWIIWCSTYAKDKEKASRLIAPVANYLENTSTRVPFSDWYHTNDGSYVGFIARSVQGGIFMPMFALSEE